MAFAPASPLTLDGMPKFLSFVYHRYVNAAVFTFAELGIADRFTNASTERGLTLDEIIGENRSQWNSDLLYRVLRSNMDVGLVKRIKKTNNNDDDTDYFVLTSSGQMLKSDHPSHARDLIRFYLSPIVNTICSQLPDLVRDRSADITQATDGTDFFTFLFHPDRKEFMMTFDSTMTALSMYDSDKLATAVDFSRFISLVDIGGSHGIFLAQILQHHPSITQGIVFDLPQVADEVNTIENIDTLKDIKKKMTFISGNMFDSSTIPQADAYLLKYILHDYGDEKAIAILISIREANQNRTSPITIFIVEHIILPEGAISNWQAHAFDVAMACSLQGARERTEHEYEQLLKRAGFELKKLYPVQAPNSIIEAILSQ